MPTTPTPNFCAIDGGVLAYYEVGSGAPLLMINGGPGVAHIAMLPVAHALAAQRRCILFDQRGTGQSVLARIEPETIRVDLMVRDIESLRISLGLERWAVLGHSFGGLLAMSYASQYPQRVERLVLVCSAGLDTGFMTYFRANIAARLGLKERARLLELVSMTRDGRADETSERELARLLAPALLYHRELADEVAATMIGRGSRVSEVNRLVWEDIAERPHDLTQKLHAVDAPALVISGRQDYMAEEVPLKIAAALPNSRLEWINECGHLPWLDQPARFNSLAEQFLA